MAGCADLFGFFCYLLWRFGWTRPIAAASTRRPPFKCLRRWHCICIWSSRPRSCGTYLRAIRHRRCLAPLEQDSTLSFRFRQSRRPRKRLARFVGQSEENSGSTHCVRRHKKADYQHLQVAIRRRCDLSHSQNQPAGRPLKGETSGSPFRRIVKGTAVVPHQRSLFLCRSSRPYPPRSPAPRC